MKLFFRKLGWLIRRGRKQSDLQEEIRFHLEEEAEELEARGLASEEARRAAGRDLGNSTLVQENTRAAWGWTFLEQFAQDARYAWRTMTADKSFSALAILSLALGIGANTAIFSFMDSILLRSLPVPDPQSLVALRWHMPQREMHGTNRHDDSYTDPKGGFVGGFFSYAAFNLFRSNDSVFSSVFGYQGAGTLNLTVRSQAELVKTEYVSGEYFGGLATRPAAGRLIAPDDDRAGAPAVAAISFALSQRLFGRPAKAASQSIDINGIPFTVIGVTLPGFFGADPDRPPDIYIPMHTNLLLEAADKFDPPAQTYIDPDYDWVIVMARIRPGVSGMQAQAALGPSFLELERAAKPKARQKDLPRLVVGEASGGLDGLRRRYSKPLYILLTMVGLILMIACANLANLMLARAAARRREIAVRLSIGAGRWRVIRQLLTESVLLALLGGSLGVAFAGWGIRSLTLLLANGRENFTLGADLNWHVLGVVAGLSVLTGVLFGLAPALQSTRVDLLPALKESRTGEGLVHRFRALKLSRVLIVSQVAITLVILMAAGLFVRTLMNLESIQLGFNHENVLTFSLNARQAGHDEAELPSFYNDLRRRFAEIPGVLSVSLSNHSLIGDGMSGTGVSLPSGEDKDSHILAIGSDFFTTMQIPILTGRGIDERDRPGAPLVAVVNETFARSYLSGTNPLGQRVALARVCATCRIEIVGVSANSLYDDVKAKAPPTVYLPFAQSIWPMRGMIYELRTAGNPMGYVRAVRDLVHQVDERLPLSDVKTQNAWIDETMGQEIMFARLCGAFALLALAIACVGLYATTLYSVARRTGEIGIRMALGAQRSRVVWMVLREVFVLAAIGLVIGVAAAVAVSKLIESFLYEMKPNDPAAVAGSVAILAGAAILAGYLPARNASQIDPMIAVRHE